MILRKISLSVLLISGLLFLGLLFSRQKAVLFPLGRSDFKGTRYEAFCDQTEGGSTIITRNIQDDDHIYFEYTLGIHKVIPLFAGFNIENPRGYLNPPGDYPSLRLKIKGTPGDIQLQFKYYLEGMTRAGDYSTYIYFEYPLTITETTRVYSIPMKKIQLSSWWMRNTLNDLSGIKKEDLKLAGIEIINGLTRLPGKSNFVEVFEMALVSPAPGVFLFPGLLFAAAAAGMGISLIKKKPPTPLPLSGLKNRGEEEIEILRRTMKTRYREPDFSLEKVLAETGLSEKKAREAIKKAGEGSFKQYLNRLRVEEALILLKNSDRQITEIGFFLGYNSATHFYRAFKQLTNLSPREYRDKETHL